MFNKTALIKLALRPALSRERANSKRALAKKRFWQELRFHCRRIVLEIVNLFFNHDWLFALIGKLNQKWHLIESVFLAYPATAEYWKAYVYAYRLPKVRWNPWLAGLLWQDGKLGVMFVISAHNGDFRDPANAESLRRVTKRMEQLKQLFQAQRKTFAGILPGILFGKRIIRETHEADVTVQVVKQAIEEVKYYEALNDDTPLIILGGRGFIGRRLVASLPKKQVYSVDIAEGKGRNGWPFYLWGKRAFLINITLNNALDEYLDLLWSELVLLNEVYPEPSAETISQLQKIGCHCYHVKGVKAVSLPQFPHAYRGAIPCCSARPSEKMKVQLLRVV